MPDNGSPTHFEVAVIGAGQAGLAIGYLLARQDRRFLILDGADSIGASWRDRWESLVLFTPRRYDSLPGLAFPGDPDGYPTRDEVVAYLEQYASTFELPVQLDSTVRSLAMNGRGFELGLDGHSIEADQVVIATGPFQTPRVPTSPASSRLTYFRPTAVTTAAKRSPRRDGPGCRWRQHRLSDRDRAISHASGPPRHWRTPNAVTAEARRPRPVLVA